MLTIAALIVSTAAHAQAEIEFVEVAGEGIGGGQTCFSDYDADGVVDGQDFVVWKSGAAIDPSGRWLAARWFWTSDAPYQTLPIDLLPETGFGDSSAHASFFLPEIEDEVIVGFMANASGVEEPCMWSRTGDAPFVLGSLPNPGLGGEALCVSQVSIPDQMTIVLGGFIHTPDLELPCIWTQSDGYDIKILPSAPGGGRVTHIGDTSYFGWVVLADGSRRAAMWRADDLELVPLDADLPEHFVGTTVTCGFGDGMLGGAMYSSEFPVAMVMAPQQQRNTFYWCLNPSSAVAERTGVLGMLSSPRTGEVHGRVGWLENENGVIVPAWNREGAWPGSRMMEPIQTDLAFIRQRAVSGVITPDEFVLIALSGETVNGAKTASLLVGVDASCTPDCNGDGVLNILDFVCFQNKFQAGCP